LVAAHAVVLLRDRLLHLQHKVGLTPDVVCAAEDLRAGTDEVVVGDRGAGPCLLLDEHAVTGGNQLMHSGRRDRDAVLVVLDLAGDPDLHV
jgi:hypothetical protein